MTQGSRPSEFSLIAQAFAPLAKAPGAFGLKDDAATLAPPAGQELVVTTDTLVAGVHFLAGDPADSIARKALRVNLSDLAAKGAAPLHYLLNLSLPPDVSTGWIGEFVRGLAQDQAAFGISLLGGDTTSTPGPLTLSITAFGSVPVGKMLRRAGAQVGDRVFVSGTIGDAGAGLSLLREAKPALSDIERDYLISRYRVPTPRLALGQGLRDLATASLDVSDGLIADLGHIAETSNVRILIESEKLPLSAALKAFGGSDVVRAATFGDDYEIAFTAPASAESAIRAADKTVMVTCIGRVEAGQGVALLDANDAEIPIAKQGFTHF